MDQLSTVLEIMQNVRSLSIDQRDQVMQYVKQMSSLKAETKSTYRMRALQEIRLALNTRPSF